MNLKTKFSLYITAPVFVILFGLGCIILSLERLHLTREIDNRHIELTKALAQKYSDSLGQSDLVLFEFFRILESEPGFIGAAMTDGENVVKVHSDLTKIGTLLPPAPAPFKNRDEVRRQIYNDEDGRAIRDFAAFVREANGDVAIARLFFNDGQVDGHLRTALLKLANRILFVGALALIFGFIGALILAHKFIVPIDSLIFGMHKLSAGGFHLIPELRRRDEMGSMISEFNLMARRLKELDLMKQEFVAAVTHELRSPLTSIERFVSLLLKGRYGRLMPEQQDALMSIRNNAVRLNSFVDDILTTAKLESRRMALFIEEIDVRDVLREVENIFSPFSTGSPVRLSVQMPEEPVVLRTDRSILVHVLSNLVSNAFKFTKEGDVTIQLGDFQNSVALTVKDTGIGIPEEEKAFVFEKFFRGAGAANTTKGTGLGLSIVKSFVRLLKGKVEVADNAQRGAVFTVTLPKDKNLG